MALTISLLACLVGNSQGPKRTPGNPSTAVVEPKPATLMLELDRAIRVLKRGSKENWQTRDQYLIAFRNTPDTDSMGRSVGAGEAGYGQHPVTAIPSLIIGNVDRAQSSDWNIHPVLSRWDGEPLLTRVFFDRVLRTGLQGFRETSGKNLPIVSPASSLHFGFETGDPCGRQNSSKA